MASLHLFKKKQDNKALPSLSVTLFIFYLTTSALPSA